MGEGGRERLILYRAESLIVHVCSFSQQVFVDVYKVSGSLLCGQDMVLNINDFIWWLRRRGKSSPLQGTCGRGNPQCWALESVRWSRLPSAEFVPGKAKRNGKLSLISPWELSA